MKISIQIKEAPLAKKQPLVLGILFFMIGFLVVKMISHCWRDA